MSRTPGRRRRVRRAFRLDPAGLVGAQVGSWIALSPSLIPRVWWSTAANVTVSATGGYLAGVLTGRLVDGLRGAHRPANRWSHRIPPQVLAGSVSFTLLMLARSETRQREIAALTGLAAARTDRDAGVPGRQVLGFTVGTTAWLGLVGAAHIGLTARRATAYGLRRATRRTLRPATTLAAAGALCTILDLVVLDGLLQALTRRAIDANRRILAGRRPPEVSERSGSTASHEPFDTLGAHGQAMVSDGPRAADLTATATGEVREPIRAYAGRLAHDDLEAAARAVVAELHRTGAFERSVVTVFTSTGTGWVQEWSLSAIEHLTGGDCAGASMQYSYLPSWLAFLANRRRARDSGRILLAEVRREIEARPVGERPRLLVSGESLGSYGGQGAFADLEGLVAGVDGAVWVGTPRSTPLWQDVVGQRDPGSTEVAPRVRGGRNIRFATGPRTADDDLDPRGWHPPRIVYAQHPSDPVVWWEPRLIWSRPSWLREPPGPRALGARGDVSEAVRWWPWVTFWQLLADMARSVSVPGGHGHNYHEELVPIWAAVLGLDVPPERLARIERAIRASIRPH